MAENCNKMVLTVKQKQKLTEKFENRESVIKLVKDYKTGTERLCTWNDANELTFSELLPMKTT
jgi:hypothetical protein